MKNFMLKMFVFSSVVFVLSGCADGKHAPQTKVEKLQYISKYEINGVPYMEFITLSGIHCIKSYPYSDGGLSCDFSNVELNK